MTLSHTMICMYSNAILIYNQQRPGQSVPLSHRTRVCSPVSCYAVPKMLNSMNAMNPVLHACVSNILLCNAPRNLTPIDTLSKQSHLDSSLIFVAWPSIGLPDDSQVLSGLDDLGLVSKP